MKRCANCGDEPEEEYWSLCGECNENLCDGSQEQRDGWRALSVLVNGQWTTDDMRAFADSPEVQEFVRQLIAAMELRSLFILKEAKKITEV